MADAGDIALLAVRLGLEILDALIGQPSAALGDDHGMDRAASHALRLERVLLVAEAQPGLLGGLEALASTLA